MDLLERNVANGVTIEAWRRTKASYYDLCKNCPYHTGTYCLGVRNEIYRTRAFDANYHCCVSRQPQKAKQLVTLSTNKNRQRSRAESWLPTNISLGSTNSKFKTHIH